MNCKHTKLPFAAILVNRAPSGEMHNYCTPPIIKEKFENFLIHRCNYILIYQVYCVWRVVKIQTVISNNPVYCFPTTKMATTNIYQCYAVRTLLVLLEPFMAIFRSTGFKLSRRVDGKFQFQKVLNVVHNI